jgi:hypothetical protein
MTFAHEIETHPSWIRTRPVKSLYLNGQPGHVISISSALLKQLTHFAVEQADDADIAPLRSLTSSHRDPRHDLTNATLHCSIRLVLSAPVARRNPRSVLFGNIPRIGVEESWTIEYKFSGRVKWTDEP